jgi:hypothetical protein
MDRPRPTSFAVYARALRPLLDAAVAARLATLRTGLPTAGEAPLRALLCGGKKLRGTLLCLTAEALGGAREEALPRAVAVELIQTASLIHDDVVDGDALRRGGPAVWSILGPRRAVLLGDVLFASAIEDVSRIGPREGEIVSRAIARLAEGALAEPLDPAALVQAVESGRFPGDAYERIVGLKTGVLFGAACSLGALSAGATGAVCSHALRFGTLVGEAYQLADDREDLRRFLAGGTRGPERFAPLAPALLCCAPETRPQVLALLRGTALPAAERQRLLGAATRGLSAQIRRRSEAAGAALGSGFPATPLSPALSSAPGEIIRQFLGVESGRAAR